MGGAKQEGPEVVKNYLTFSRAPKRQFGDCSKSSDVPSEPMRNAARCSDSSAVKRCFVRNGPRLPRYRTRAAMFSEDFPDSVNNRAWSRRQATRSRFAPDQLALHPSQLHPGVADWPNLAGTVDFSSGSARVCGASSGSSVHIVSGAAPSVPGPCLPCDVDGYADVRSPGVLNYIALGLESLPACFAPRPRPHESSVLGNVVPVSVPDLPPIL